MNYEKKYKEALESLKGLLEGVSEGNYPITKDDIIEIFPELKENEDERIRKWLEEHIEAMPDNSIEFKDVKRIDVLHWLEKQDTQPRYNIGDILCDKLCTTLNKDAQPNMEIVDIKNGMYICDKGSFPVSQQDEYVLVGKRIDSKLNDNSVSNELRTASFAHAEKELKNQTFPDNLEFELIYTFEKGAKWDAAQKPTWSNKDKKILDELITFFTKMVLPKDHDFRIYASWLKALKAQNTWKPSDAQMIALNDVITNGHLSNANERILKGLQEQLKKLK